MAVLLLWERQRGRASPVWGYVEQLPASIDTPVRWSEAELAELQYAPAISEVGLPARMRQRHLICWFLLFNCVVTRRGMYPAVAWAAVGLPAVLVEWRHVQTERTGAPCPLSSRPVMLRSNVSCSVAPREQASLPDGHAPSTHSSCVTGAGQRARGGWPAGALAAATSRPTLSPSNLAHYESQAPAHNSWPSPPTLHPPGADPAAAGVLAAAVRAVLQGGTAGRGPHLCMGGRLPVGHGERAQPGLQRTVHRQFR